MAVCLSASTTGHQSVGVSALSVSLLHQSKRLPLSCNPSTSTFPLLGGSVSAGGFRSGARCQSAELEAPMTAKSLYSLLGLEQGVNLDDIKTSYRKLARRYHPDVCPVDEREECTKIFLQVQDAYEVLSDPERRAKYDYQMMHPLSPGAVGWGSMIRRRSDGDIDPAEWRWAWREQLAHFTRKEQKADSWAAKMRAKRAQSSQQNH